MFSVLNILDIVSFSCNLGICEQMWILPAKLRYQIIFVLYNPSIMVDHDVSFLSGFSGVSKDNVMIHADVFCNSEFVVNKITN